MTPRVWNKRDPNLPADAVYVGRPSRWGNPFTFGNSRTSLVSRENVLESREAAIEAYRTQVLPNLALGELRGHDLVCWCAPLPCHADLLLEAANR